MSSVASSPSRTSTLNSDPNRDLPAPYFNETGPIYQKEHAQAKEFVKFVRSHVVVAANKNPDGNTNTRKEIVRFDWEAFRAAVASLQASDLSAEHDLTVSIPPTPTMGSDIAETTIQAVLDALVAHFASTFTDVLFVPPTSNTSDIDGGENSQTHFFDTLRKNFYHAFTHHLEASDAPERCLSFRRCTSANPGADARARSAWEYRLLFVHSDVRLKTVRGLVMTVTLEGSFEGNRGGGDGEEVWYGVSLDSRGPFSGTLKAMQVIVGEGFRCP